MASSDYNTLLKLLLIGDSGVGKSCMIVRYVDETFRTTYITTVGIDFKLKTLEIDGKRIRLQIWDTAGQERFHTMTTAYYRGAVGIVLVYDITREKSFDNITKWLGDIELHASTDVEKLLVGSKCDLESERIVPYEVGEQMAKAQGITFIETSAKTNHNIDEAFDILAKEIVKKKVARRQDSFLDLQERQVAVKTCSC